MPSSPSGQNRASQLTQLIARPFAHRGLHGPGRIENSRAAFEAAIEAGSGIELDVQASADGEAMVFHDYDLARLAQNEGKVAELGAADLARIRLKGSDETIPTLREILTLIGGKAALLIEVKSPGREIGGLSRSVAELRVRLTNASLSGFDLGGTRQELHGDTLTVHRETAADLKADYSLAGGLDSSLLKFTQPEPLVQSTHPDIKRLAGRISRGSQDPRYVAERINRWVYDSLRKRITFGIPSALHGTHLEPQLPPKAERGRCRSTDPGPTGEPSAASDAFLDAVDGVRHQSVRLAVHGVGGLGVGCLDEAEDLALALVDPVAQVVDPVRVLGGEVGLVGLGHVLHRDSVTE